MPDRATDWTLVREALEAAPCIVTWCAPDHPCSRCAALVALKRLEPSSDALACGCGWVFVDATDAARGCPACALGVRVDADCAHGYLAAGGTADCPACAEVREVFGG